MRRVVLCYVYGVMLAMFANTALGGSFKVYPLKLELDGQNKTATLRLTNTSDAAVTVQLEGKRWFQDARGEDRYEATRDIIYFPRIVTVERGGQAIVRLGYQGNGVLRQEGTYRLFVQEIPADQTGALKMALRFGVPVFVSPGTAKPRTALDDMALTNGTLSVKVANTGNTHVIVQQIKVTGLDEQERSVFSRHASGWYVLAGTSRTFSVPLSNEECRQVQALTVEAEAGESIIAGRLEVRPAHCVGSETS